MTKAEMHYLQCQNENCEKAYCVDRRTLTSQVEKFQSLTKTQVELLSLWQRLYDEHVTSCSTPKGDKPNG